jgi:Protein of unknown function DUF262
MAATDGSWYEDMSEQELDDFPVDTYDLAASPNDFNISTIFSFIESGAVVIPGFQRNYVWDQKRASKLIESLIVGLPVPQVFLYEEGKNKFLVIDGQQRLMSIYYFVKQRFPRLEKRAELRGIFEGSGKIPEEVLQDDRYFTKFNLQLPTGLPKQKNRFHDLNYSTLGEYRAQFDLRTIRNVIIKQIHPQDDDSAIYEIFNRLNSGGVNLRPQEIRFSLYSSTFLDAIRGMNANPKWRRILNSPEPDIHMKDAEFLIRAFGLLLESDSYSPSMVRFLNTFARKAKQMKVERITELETFFNAFLDATDNLPDDSFRTASGRFTISVFESVFCAVGKPAMSGLPALGMIDAQSIEALRADKEFIDASAISTSDTTNVKMRISRATALIKLV